MFCICYKVHCFSPPPMGNTPAQAPVICHPRCCSSLPTASPASAHVPSQSVLNTTARVMLQKYVTSRCLSARNAPAASPPTRGETQSPVLCDVTSCSHPLLSPLSHPASLIVLEHTRQNPAPGPLHLLRPQAEKPFSGSHILPPHPRQTFIQMPPPQGGFAWSP